MNWIVFIQNNSTMWKTRIDLPIIVNEGHLKCVEMPWRRHRKVHRKNSLQSVQKNEMNLKMMREQTQQSWVDRHTEEPPLRFTIKQIGLLRRWFDSIDEDGSGDITIEEMKEPLLSVGAAINMHQVNAIMQAVDVDGSGAIGFDEFVQLFIPRGNCIATPYLEGSFHKLKAHVEAQSKGLLEIPTQIIQERRTFLMDTIMTRKEAQLEERELQRGIIIRQVKGKYIQNEERFDALQTLIEQKTREKKAKSEIILKEKPRDIRSQVRDLIMNSKKRTSDLRFEHTVERRDVRLIVPRTFT